MGYFKIITFLFQIVTRINDLAPNWLELKTVLFYISQKRSALSLFFDWLEPAETLSIKIQFTLNTRFKTEILTTLNW